MTIDSDRMEIEAVLEAVRRGHHDKDAAIIAGQFAPGAVIFDTNNRTITPGFLPVRADVLYTIDQAGSVTRIYLLTPQEQERLDAVKR